MNRIFKSVLFLAIASLIFYGGLFSAQAWQDGCLDDEHNCAHTGDKPGVYTQNPDSGLYWWPDCATWADPGATYPEYCCNLDESCIGTISAYASGCTTGNFTTCCPSKMTKSESTTSASGVFTWTTSCCNAGFVACVDWSLSGNISKCCPGSSQDDVCAVKDILDSNGERIGSNTDCTVCGGYDGVTPIYVGGVEKGCCYGEVYDLDLNVCCGDEDNHVIGPRAGSIGTGYLPYNPYKLGSCCDKNLDGIADSVPGACGCLGPGEVCCSNPNSTIEQNPQGTENLLYPNIPAGFPVRCPAENCTTDGVCCKVETCGGQCCPGACHNGKCCNDTYCPASGACCLTTETTGACCGTGCCASNQCCGVGCCDPGQFCLSDAVQAGCCDSDEIPVLPGTLVWCNEVCETTCRSQGLGCGKEAICDEEGTCIPLCDENGTCLPLVTNEPTPPTPPLPPNSPPPPPPPAPAGTSSHKECNVLGGCVPVQGTGVDICSTNADCQPNVPNPLPLACNADQQCVFGGTGPSCASSAECEDYPTCSSSETCIPDGGGSYCSADAECASPPLSMNCNSHQQCVPGGTGPSCASSAECEDYPTCSSFYTCIVGGGGSYCSVYYNNCSNLLTTCNAYQQCVPGGTGPSCSLDSDCQQKKCGCSLHGSQICDANQTGADCTIASTCPDCPTQPKCGCDAFGNKVCDTLETGANCTIAYDCIYLFCSTQAKCGCDDSGNKICNTNQTGANCTDANTCPTCFTPGFGCNSSHQCVSGGTLGSCTVATQATDCYTAGYGCNSNGNGQCVLGGTGNACTVATQAADCPIINSVPSVGSLVVGTQENYCSSLGYVTFQWIYSDAESDAQTYWEIQISTGIHNFDANMVLDSKVAGSANTAIIPMSTSPTSSCAPICSYINYGTHYYWRVKVWQNDGQASDWIYYTNPTSSPVNTYIYPYAHPGPLVSYTYVPPINIVPGATVTFIDSSICYYNDGSSYACSAGVSNTYTWWFERASNTTSDITTKSNPSHVYVSPGPYTTKLTVCDDIDCCSKIQNITVKTNVNSVPQWWEISPF